MANEYWAMVGHGDRFSAGPEDSRHRAVGALSRECVSGQCIRVGKRQEIDIVSLFPDGEQILEVVGIALCNAVGEVSEDWAPSDKAERDLTERTKEMFAKWVDDHDLHPKFFEVVEITEHTVP